MFLRHSNLNPKISAYTHIYCPYNYDAAPFVPIDTESLVRDNPRQHKTFSNNSQKGFALDTSFEHHHAWIMSIKVSLTTRVLATVFHKHKYISNPLVSLANSVMMVMIPSQESYMNGQIPPWDSSMSGLIHHNPCLGLRHDWAQNLMSQHNSKHKEPGRAH